jgi:hypothetical protein
MATRIVFAAARGDGALGVSVEENSESVEDKWKKAKGMPFQLTLTRGLSGTVWINPATVAYWHEAPSGQATTPS